MSSRITRFSLSAAAVVMALSLAGCGQGEQGTTNTQSGANADTPNAERNDSAGQQGDQASGNSQSSDKPELLDAGALQKQIIDHTVAGTMSSGSNYGEYYAPDGKILAAGYTGSWTIQDDRLCLDYGDSADCYRAALDGMNVVWYLDGDKVGTGTLRPGNPNGYGENDNGSNNADDS